MFKDGIVLKNALDSTQIQTAVSLVNGLLKETTQSRYKTHTATVSTRTQLLPLLRLLSYIAFTSVLSIGWFNTSGTNRS